MQLRAGIDHSAVLSPALYTFSGLIDDPASRDDSIPFVRSFNKFEYVSRLWGEINDGEPRWNSKNLKRLKR